MGSFRKIFFVSTILVSVVILCGCANQKAEVQTGGTQMQSVSKTAKNLAVLWTSGDPAVAYKVCFMYTHIRDYTVFGIYDKDFTLFP